MKIYLFIFITSCLISFNILHAATLDVEVVNILKEKEQELCVQKVAGECADKEGFKKVNTLWKYALIERNPAVVWDILMDLKNYGKWNTFMPYASSLMQQGDLLSFKVRMGNWYTHAETVVISERRDFQDFCWGSAPLVAGKILITKRCKHLYPLQEGRTLYYTTEKFQGALAGVLKNSFGSQISQGLEREAQNLVEYSLVNFK